MTFSRRSLLAVSVDLTALSAFGKTLSPAAANFSKLANKRRAMARSLYRRPHDGSGRLVVAP